MITFLDTSHEDPLTVQYMALDVLKYLQNFTGIFDNCRKYPIFQRPPCLVFPLSGEDCSTGTSGHAWTLSALKGADIVAGTGFEEIEIDKTVIRKGGFIFRF